MFSLADVAFAASEIVVLCLERKRQVGTAALGPTGRVLAKLVRTDGPAVLRDLGDGDGDGDAEVGWIGVPGGGRLMWSNERGNNGSLLETE